MNRLTELLTRAQGGNRIRFRILIPLALAIGVLLATFAFAFWRVQRKEQAKDADLWTQQFDRLLHIEEHQKAAVLKTTMEAVMNDGQFIGALRRRDRAALLVRAKPLLDSLHREHGITHFYFDLPDRTVFLRVHDPGTHGGKIDRETMREAEQTGKVSAGIERGLTGIFTLRVVSPWRQDGELLGYVELGIEFETIVQHIDQQLTQDVDFVLAVEKKFLDRGQWADAQKRAGRTDDWDRFPRVVIINKSVETLPQLAVDYLLAENGAKGSRQAGDLHLVFLPLTDFTGGEIGRLIVLHNVAEQRAATGSAIQLVLVFGATIGAAVIVFFYFFLTRLERDLCDRTAKLKDVIAESIRAEEVLRESEERFSGAFEHAPIGMALVSPDGRWLKVNRALCDLVGYSEAELLTRTFQDITHPGDLAIGLENMRRMIAGEIRSCQMEKHYVHTRGHLVTVLLNVSIVRDGQGQPRYFIAQIQDITERKELEAQMERLRTEHALVLNSIGEGVHWIDVDGRIKFENPAAARMLGYEVSQLIGRPAHATMHHTRADGAAYPRSECLIHATMTDRVVRRVTDEVFWRKDGSSFAVEYLCTPVCDQNGRSGGAVVIFTDITERRHAEAKLAEASGLLEAMFENSPDFIYFKDRASRFVRFSKACLSKFGLTKPEMLEGKTDSDFYSVPHAQSTLADEQEIIRTGHPMVAKLEKGTYPDGRITWTLTTKMPWTDGTGAIHGTFGISKDITALKETEEELEHVHRKLLESCRRAGMAEVATGVLHNVGNVLNSVNVSATLIADHVRHTKAANIAKLAVLFDQHKVDLAGFLTTDPRGQMLPAYLGTLAEMIAAEQTTLIAELEYLRKNIDHIKDIVATQQAYARTSGVIETVSLPDLIEDALRINAGSLARHNVDTIRDYRARPVITTDRQKVMQILINLLRNAKYACDESGRTDKQITVGITNHDRGVHVTIADNGVGIPAENLTRIFNHGFTTRKGGHGFGLHGGALAARELGGALSVQSEGPGHGATFILELPLKPDSPAHENPVR